MNNPFEHIEAFVSGSLSPEEMQFFEQAMRKDAALREEVDMVKEMEMFAQRKADNKGAIDVVSQVMEEGKSEEMDKRGEEGRVKRINFQRRTFYLVAAALVAILILVLLPKGGAPVTGEELFAEYFDPEMASFMTKSPNENSDPIQIQADSVLQLAEYAYNLPNYEKAVTLFAQYHLLNDTINPEVEYYNSIALLGAKNSSQALSNFDLINDKSGMYRNDISWYKALSSIHNKDYRSAIQLLNEISTESVRYNSSQELLQQLAQLSTE